MQHINFHEYFLSFFLSSCLSVENDGSALYKRAEPDGHGISDLTGWQTPYGVRYGKSFLTQAYDASLPYGHAHSIQCGEMPDIVSSR